MTKTLRFKGQTAAIQAGIVGLLGYTSGLHRKRPAFPTILMSSLIVLVVFMVIDLDRPRRGLIKVNQHSLADSLIQIQDYQSVDLLAP